MSIDESIGNIFIFMIYFCTILIIHTLILKPSPKRKIKRRMDTWLSAAPVPLIVSL